MKDVVVARRYARALFQAARKAGASDGVRQELKRFAQALRTDETLSRVLAHPLLAPAAKKRAAAAALGGSPSRAFGRFLDLLLAKKRLPLVPPIAALYDDLADEADDIRRVQVKSAAPLDRTQTRALETRLAKAWGKKVAVEASVDESLLGGLVLRAGDAVWDASLRGRLRRMREKLLEAASS